MISVAPSHHLAADTDVTAIQQTRAGMLTLVERRLAYFITEQRTHWAGVDSRALQPIDAISALISSGGKRLRPVFCLSGFLAAGGRAGDPAAVDASAALELLQAFALIHDDVMDNASLRRGAPSVHEARAAEHRSRGWHGESRRFGEGVAILAGDLSFAYADQLITRLPAPARAVWNELKAEMIIGQHLDVAVAAETVVDPALSRWIAVRKSGHYTIHRPLILGATLAGRPDLGAAIEGYGVALGEAFQLRDDLIDAFGSTAAAGKPTGLDFTEHKMTLLLALAAERDSRVLDLLENTGAEPWDADLLRSVLEETGARAIAERAIAELVDKACDSIAGCGLDPSWRREFSLLATQVAYRSH